MSAAVTFLVFWTFVVVARAILSNSNEAWRTYWVWKNDFTSYLPIKIVCFWYVPCSSKPSWYHLLVFIFWCILKKIHEGVQIRRLHMGIWVSDADLCGRLDRVTESSFSPSCFPFSTLTGCDNGLTFSLTLLALHTLMHIWSHLLNKSLMENFLFLQCGFKFAYWVSKIFIFHFHSRLKTLGVLKLRRARCTSPS